MIIDDLEEQTKTKRTNYNSIPIKLKYHKRSIYSVYLVHLWKHHRKIPRKFHWTKLHKKVYFSSDYCYSIVEF